MLKLVCPLGLTALLLVPLVLALDLLMALGPLPTTTGRELNVHLPALHLGLMQSQCFLNG